MKVDKLATLSADGRYRYTLTRIWRVDYPLLVVCMLNPSTADAYVDDPTIQRLTQIGWDWGFGGLLVVNLYAFRSSSPAAMLATPDPVGPANEAAISESLHYAGMTSGVALVAWGNNAHPNRVEAFTRWAGARLVRLVCLGTTQSGAPKHPMARGHHRIPDGQQPIDWKPA